MNSHARVSSSVPNGASATSKLSCHEEFFSKERPIKGIVSSRSAVAAALILAGTASTPAAFADAFNPVCPVERVTFNPGNGEAGSQAHDPDGSPVCKVPADQAFPDGLRGINRPTTLRFGPDGALYLVDYGAVRDPGGADPGSQFADPADAPLVQIPGTGVIWKITRVGGGGRDDDD